MIKKILMFLGLDWVSGKCKLFSKRRAVYSIADSPNHYISEFKVEDEIHVLTREQYKNKSKTQLVLEHLRLFGSITCEGIEWYYKYSNGSAIIYELKKRGFEIVTHKYSFVEGNGKNKTISVYVLIK